MVGTDDDVGNAGGAGEITTIATLEGVTIQGVAQSIDAGDFVF